MASRPLAPTFQPDRWVPSPELAGQYRISEFMRAAGTDDLHELVRRAARDPEWFYPAVHDFLGVGWMRPWERVRDDSPGIPFTRWFVGGGTNLAWLACERWADQPRPAVVWEGDDGTTRTLSYPELADAVRRASAGLRRLGVGPGDVVAMHLPPVPEAVVTMLAVAGMGAIVAPDFSGYGADALADRLVRSGARVIVTADGMLRRGARLPMLATALEAVGKSPAVRDVVVVRRLGDPLPGGPRLVSWDELSADDDAAPVPVLDAETPWLLMYTSGSTGRPKGAVHTHGGFPYVVAVELALSLDVRPGDRFSWPADMGWLAGPQCAVGPLTLGATSVVFEGVPNHPAPDRPWRLVERHGITQYGMSPTGVRMLAGAGERWVEPYELSTLRVLATAGEPMTLGAWRWLHRHVGRGWAAPVNWSGGTEIGGSIVSGYPNWPTDACHFSSAVVGMDVDVVDESGLPVVGQVGELVLRRTSPATTRGFWNEPDRYLETYWTRLPGLWVHGDRAVRYADGSFTVPGRSDDLLKIAGKRVGPSELETLALEVDGVAAAAAVGVDDPTKGQLPVLVVAATERRGDPRLPGEVSDHIVAAMGRPMRPAAVLVVADLPRTRSGKTHRRAVRGWITGNDPGDLSSLDNPDVEEELRKAGAAASLDQGAGS